MLLQAGARTDYQNYGGLTAAAIAEFNGDWEVAQLLNASSVKD
jgi:hypothetical protein